MREKERKRRIDIGTERGTQRERKRGRVREREQGRWRKTDRDI